MKRFSQLVAMAATALASLAQAQTLDANASSKRGFLDELAPNLPIRWNSRHAPPAESIAPSTDKLPEQGTLTMPQPPLVPSLGTASWLLQRLDPERSQRSGGFPRNRLEFEQQFAPTRDFANPLQQGISQWFYRTNDLIFTWYGGFEQWQRDFDNTVSQMVFGKSPPSQSNESFWGQPRIKTKLDPSGAAIRIDLPFGK
jgi:hypothetical protein